jgi:hypothetical protein
VPQSQPALVEICNLDSIVPRANPRGNSRNSSRGFPLEGGHPPLLECWLTLLSKFSAP